MKHRTKRLLILFLLGFLATAGVVRAYFPDIWEKTGQPFEEYPVVAQTIKTGEQKTKEFEEVLGKQVKQTQDKVETGSLPVETIVNEVMNDSELVKEIQTRVETIVTEKTREIQELPEEAVDQIKKEIKKELHQQMCEEWLSEE